MVKALAGLFRWKRGLLDDDRYTSIGAIAVAEKVDSGTVAPSCD
jgi:hypothetical protein